MNGSERFGPVLGANLSQAYVGNLDAVAQLFQPLAVGAGRYNLELFGLMTRRTRAWLEVPTRLSQCRTPNDLVNEQLRFWQAAVQDYADGAKRLALAFSSFAAPGLDGRGTVATSTRDYLGFPDAKTTAAEPAKRDRRAA